MATLSEYITECRRLLHDANGNFWSDPELTDYINEARAHVVRDTGCLRQIQIVNFTTGKEVYSFGADFPDGARTLDIINVNIYWGNSRTPLRYLAWTDFNAQLRYWQNYRGLPIAFSMYGQNKMYVGPVPQENYTAEVDTVILPAPLTAGTDVDEILDPYTDPVAYHACYKAKYKEQSFGEAEIFKQEYINHVKDVLTSVFTRRMPTPYSTAY